MVGRGHEAGLAAVGLFGGGLGALERLGPLAHPRLERLVGPAQGFGGPIALAHVGIGRDEAAIGHAVVADLEHRSVGPLALVDIGPGQRRHVTVDQLAGEIGGAVFAARAVERHQLLQRQAHAREVGRQVEQFHEPGVPRGDPQLVVEGADALGHAFERAGQQLVVRPQGLRGLMEHGAGRARRQVASLERGRGDDHPRGGRPDRPGQQMLGELDRVRVGQLEGGQGRIGAPGAAFEIGVEHRIAPLAPDEPSGERAQVRKPQQRPGRAAAAPWSARPFLNALAWSRSTTSWRLRIEMETNRARLTARLITVAWVIGSRPCTPKRAVGLSHARPHGPSRNRAAGRGSKGTIEGASSV